MIIQDEQLAILDSLKVERLNVNPENIALASTFTNVKNPNLEKVISTAHASQKDKDGSIAYYVVKTKDGVLLLYFSLKCGELFQTLDMDKMVFATEAAYHIHIINHRNNYDAEAIKKSLDYINSHLEEIKAILPNLREYARKKELYEHDIKNETNIDVQRVFKTCSAIEIVEFCSNDNARSKWKEYNLPKRMGECVFWHHIVPIIFSIRKLIGCEYVYLFAADNTKNRTLANYYQKALKFEYPNFLGTNKPHYDFLCYFLQQKINKLKEEQERFYNNFNPDETQEDIV